MQIQQILRQLEALAPPALQESYDNAGLITGNAAWECTGVLVALDCTEAIVAEAVQRGCNLVVAHHPIVFSGLKKITGKTYVERTVIQAIKHDVAIYAIHTNLDNVAAGVNQKIARQLDLQQLQILQPKQNLLLRLQTYVPPAHAEAVREALFHAGAGHIGRYSECSFSVAGTGTFKPGDGADPYLGSLHMRERVAEEKIEVLLPVYLQQPVLQALFAAHPYEEVAYELLPLQNRLQEVGSGMTGLLPEPLPAATFLALVKERFGVPCIRHTALPDRLVQKIAVCGGAGSFLTGAAIAAGADVYLTADVKYHEFFDADGKIVLADIGHYESEQFTIDLLVDFLQIKFPNFAVLKTGLCTNPVSYF
jgi:dinuclear metal center YbgI/SA1388 family protein